MIQPLECKVYPPASEHAATLASQVGIQQAQQELVVAGCLVGEAGFIQQHTAESATAVEDLGCKLMELELPVQDKLLILRKCLQLKLAHYAHCVSYAHDPESLLRCEMVISEADQTALSSFSHESFMGIMLSQAVAALRCRLNSLARCCCATVCVAACCAIALLSLSSASWCQPLQCDMLQAGQSPCIQSFCQAHRFELSACALVSAHACSLHLMPHLLKHCQQRC
jgi:hypothetical protein